MTQVVPCHDATMIRTARNPIIPAWPSKSLLLVSLLLPAVARGQAVRVGGATFDSLTGRPIPAAFITLGSPFLSVLNTR